MAPIASLTTADIKFPRPGKRKKRSSQANGVVSLLPWQVRLWNSLKDKRFRRIRAPTGSGKSVLSLGLALHDREDGFKQIISYPQHAIAPSFEMMSIRLPNGKTRRWCPSRPARETKVDAVVEFLLRPIVDTESRSLVCTHATLVRAHEKLRQMDLGFDPWSGTSLFIDEAHHSMHRDGDESDDATTNRLGAIVSHYCANAPGPLTLITATWIRINSTIVTYEQMKLFTGETYHIDEYLSSLAHLCRIKINFLVGEQLGCLRSILSDDPRRKTVVYLPLGMKADEKMTLLGACKKHAEEIGVVGLDLVTEENRDEAREGLFSAIREQKIAKANGIDVQSATPDLLWVLNIFKEGADWPELSRAVLMAPRGSLVEVLQILGRLLRDCEGKQEAEIDIILPTERDGSIHPEVAKAYIKSMMVSMVVDWQFRPVRLMRRRTKTDRVADRLMRNPATAEVVAGAVASNAIAFEGRQAMWSTVMDEVLEDLAREDPEAFDGLSAREKTKVVSDVIAQANERFMEATRQLRAVDEVQCPVELRQFQVSSVSSLGAMVGYQDLHSLRVRLRSFMPVTVDLIEELASDHYDKHGEWPTMRSGEIEGDGRKWDSLGQWLIRHGLSFRKMIKRLRGRKKERREKSRPVFTVEYILERVSAYEEKHGRPPGWAWGGGQIENDGRYWTSALNWLRKHAPKALAKIKGKLLIGRRVGSHPDRDKIISHCFSYMETHGRWPNALSGTVAGDGRTWSTMNVWLTEAGSSLSKLAAEHGIKPTKIESNKPRLPLPYTESLTVEQIMDHIVRHQQKHNKHPTLKSGLIDGDGRIWATADQILRKKYSSSLKTLCMEMGSAGSAS